MWAINNGFTVAYGSVQISQTSNSWKETSNIQLPISFTMTYPQEVCNNPTLYSHQYPNCAYSSCSSTTIKFKFYNTAQQWMHYAAFGY